MRLEYEVVNAQGQSKTCYQECGCHLVFQKNTSYTCNFLSG